MLQLLDFIADPGCDLELQFRCSAVHLFGQLFNEAHQGLGGRGGEAILANCRCALGSRLPALPTLREPVVVQELLCIGIFLGQLIGDVCDLLAQRLGVDAVIGVLGTLGT